MRPTTEQHLRAFREGRDACRAAAVDPAMVRNPYHVVNERRQWQWWNRGWNAFWNPAWSR